MRSTAQTRAALWLLAAMAIPATPAAGQDVLDLELTEQVLVERVVWPVSLYPAKCRRMDPAKLVVREDGRLCPVTRIDATAPRRIHAILVDNSSSMAQPLERLTRAASEYVKKFPAGDPVVVTSFADNVVLEAGLTASREEALDALAHLELGHRTALLDALYYTLLYLQPRPERKVVIVFTDAFDNASLGHHGERQLLAMARAMPDLTLFTVRLEHVRTPLLNSAALMDQLSRETGGDSFVVEPDGSFRDVLQAIRVFLESETFVTYSPPPFDAAPGDGEAGRPYSMREVTVTAGPDVACTVKSRGGMYRRAGAPSPEFEPTAPMAFAAGTAPVPPRPPTGCPAPDAAVEALAFPYPSTWPVTVERDSYLWNAGERLHGRTLDIVAEQGARYDPSILRLYGRYKMQNSMKPSLLSRDFLVRVPPLDEVRSRLHSAADVFVYLAEQPDCKRGEGEFGMPPTFVQGQTWLEMRGQLAEALYRWHDDYRAWADELLDRKHHAGVDALIARYAESNPLDEAEIPALRRRLAELVERPGSTAIQEMLGEWLGDTPAHVVAMELQARLVERWLADPQGGEAVRELADRLWEHVEAWLPPPTRVRVVTPLVPAYDTRSGRVGLHRIVLPRGEQFGPPIDPVPERPFVLEILDRARGIAGFDTVLTPRARVLSVAFDPLTVARPRAPEEPPPPAPPPGAPDHPAFETLIKLEVDRRPLWLGALHARRSDGSGFDLVCLRVKGEGKGARLGKPLNRELKLAGLDCDDVLPWKDPKRPIVRSLAVAQE